MKSLAWLTEEVLRDCGTRCGADTQADVRTVRLRTDYEGESFLTITLPDLGAAFDRAIASGRLDPSMTPAFGKHPHGLPKFLRGFLVQVFSLDGVLLPTPSLDAIQAIRQICNLQKKVLRECVDKRKHAALTGYRKTDDELDTGEPTNDPDTLRAFRFVSGVVWTSVLKGLPFGDLFDRLHPAHGPGTTVERVLGNSKYVLRKWYTRLERHFPFTEFGLASVRNLGEEECPLERVEFIEPQDEEPVRVTLVPKTMKTPRVIAIEPVCMQYMQQGLLRQLVPLIEKGRYTGGRVNFSDQTINGALALASSRDGRLATIDMKEASDRVSLAHVNLMLESVPHLREQIMACRSTRAVLPDGTVIPVKKFASMGSALCFPMEAMVFFIAIVARRMTHARCRLTPRNVLKMSRDVYVYGDDILVPTDEAPTVCAYLESIGLKVNQRKSFWTGKFRESCGVDAYDGHDVTPTYVRYLPPTGRHDSSEVIGWVATANQFYMKGYWQTARAMRAHVESVVGPLPHLSETSEGLGWLSYRKEIQHRRWNKTLMRFEIRTLVPYPKRRQDPLSGDSALMKCFSVIGAKAQVAKEHLQESVTRGRLALKTRWVPSY